jgi:hypothetical protein
MFRTYFLSKTFFRPVFGPVDPGGRNHHSHHLLRDEGDARVPRPDALDLCRLVWRISYKCRLYNVFYLQKYKLSSLHGLTNRAAIIRDGGKLSRRLLNVSI